MLFGKIRVLVLNDYNVTLAGKLCLVRKRK